MGQVHNKHGVVMLPGGVTKASYCEGKFKLNRWKPKNKKPWWILWEPSTARIVMMNIDRTIIDTYIEQKGWTEDECTS